MLANRVREYTGTLGTGDITLAGAMAGHVGFAEAFESGDQLSYVIEDGENYEIGLGRLADGNILVREIVNETLENRQLSKEAAAPLTLSGNAIVFCAASAEYLEALGKKTDVISEATEDVGVTVDGVHLKDGTISAASAEFNSNARLLGQVGIGGDVDVGTAMVNIASPSATMLRFDRTADNNVDTIFNLYVSHEGDETSDFVSLGASTDALRVYSDHLVKAVGDLSVGGDVGVAGNLSVTGGGSFGKLAVGQYDVPTNPLTFNATGTSAGLNLFRQDAGTALSTLSAGDRFFAYNPDGSELRLGTDDASNLWALSVTGDNTIQGQLGVGAAPQEKFHIFGDSGTATIAIQRSNAHAPGFTIGDIEWRDSASTLFGKIRLAADAHDADASQFEFTVTDSEGLQSIPMILTGDMVSMSSLSVDGDVAGSLLRQSIDSDCLHISGSTETGKGGAAVFYGDNHATRACDVLMKSNNVDFLYWDNSNTKLSVYGDFATSGNARFGGVITQNGDRIHRDVNDSNLFVSGGNALNDGSNIILYGSTHAINAGDIIFRSDSSVLLQWDNSAEFWDFQGNALTGVEQLNITGTGNGIKRNVATDLLKVSGGSSIDSGGNVVFYGESHSGHANDIWLRSGTSNRLVWDNSVTHWDFIGTNVVGIGDFTVGGNAFIDGRTAYGVFGTTGQYAVTYNPDTANQAVFHSVVDGNKFILRTGSDPYNGFTEQFSVNTSGHIYTGGSMYLGNTFAVVPEGFNNVGGSRSISIFADDNAYDAAITVARKDSTNVRGSFWLDGGIGKIYLENNWDSPDADIIFRTRTSGTTITPLMLSGDGTNTLTGDLIKGGPNIYRTSNASYIILSGGGGPYQGASIQLNGGEAVSPNTLTFFANGTSKLEYDGVGTWSYQNTHISGVNSLTTTSIETGDISTSGKLNHGAIELVTVSSNAITASKRFVDVDTSAAPQIIDTILGGQEGDELTIAASSSTNSLTVQDINSGGNIQCAGDFVMSNPADSLTLYCDGTNWREIARSNNA